MADRRPRRWGAAIALAILVAVYLLWPPTTPTDAPSDADLSPMASYRARHPSTPPREAPRPAQAEEEDEDFDTPTEWVVVALRVADQGFLLYPKHARLDPSEFWPLPGQAPFPEGRTADDLQALLRQQLDERDWLDQAFSEGLDPDQIDTEDPWAAVLALEVARRDARVGQEDAFQDALDAGEGPANGQVTMDHLVGPPEVAVQEALAHDLIDAWPDHDAAEYARLYLLDAWATRGAREDVEDARLLAVDLLRNTDDALVVSEAVGLLTTLPRTDPLEARDLDTLLDFADRFPELMDDLPVSAFALDQAMMRNDAARTKAWLARYEAEYQAKCADPDPLRNPCPTDRNNLDEAYAYAGDRSPRDADSWRQAFEIAGYACARDGHDWRTGPFRTSARWDGDWTWQPWDRPGPFTHCFVERAQQGPPPPHDRLRVRVAVVF